MNESVFSDADSRRSAYSPVTPFENAIFIPEADASDPVEAIETHSYGDDLKYTYEHARSIHSRLLSLFYFLSFLSSFNDIHGLFGSTGIYDIARHTKTFLENMDHREIWSSIRQFPSLYLVIPLTDFTLMVLPLVGMIVSMLSFITSFTGCYTFSLLWLLKISTFAFYRKVPKSVADLLLLEVGFLTIFIFSPFRIFDKVEGSWSIPTLCRWAFRGVVYKVVFFAGLSKLRLFLDHSLKLSTVLASIPLPTPLVYYLLKVCHKYDVLSPNGVVTLLFYECVLSIFVVTPIRKCRLIGGVLTLLYSLFFSLLGNFGSFYLILASCALFCFDDFALDNLVNSKYNLFTRGSRLVRKVSVDLIDNADDELFCVYVEDKAAIEDKETIEDTSEYDKVVDAITQKEYIKKILPETTDRTKSIIHTLCMVFIAVLWVFTFCYERYRGLKAVFIFLLSVMLQIHSETLHDRLRTEYTLFALQVWLVGEMLISGPSVWSFMLFLGLLELQISLSKGHHLVKTIKIMTQMFILLRTIVYGLQTLDRYNDRHHDPLEIGYPVEHAFFTFNDYGSIFPVKVEKTEFVIQGTSDTILTTLTEWKDYEFKAKPTNLDRRPTFLPFYQYSLDNTIETFSARPLEKNLHAPPVYLFGLIRKLLYGSNEVGELFYKNPFAGDAPKYVRVFQYTYEFTGAQNGPLWNGPKNGAHNDHNGMSTIMVSTPGSVENGKWFKRTFQAQVVPPLRLPPVDAPGTADVPSKPSDDAHNGPTMELHSDHKDAEPKQGDAKVVRVVHTMPPDTKAKGVPLEYADKFNNVIPNVDGLVVTK